MTVSKWNGEWTVLRPSQAFVDPLGPSQSAAKEFPYQPASVPTLTPWVLQGAENPRGAEKKRVKGGGGGATSNRVRSGYPVVSTEFSTGAKKT